MERKKKKILIIISCILAFLLAGGFIFYWFFFRKYYDRKIPNFRARTELYITPEVSWDSITHYIADSCQVKWNASLLRAVKEEEERGASLKPGHYVINQEHTSTAVARMLSHGWQTPVKLVLSGTLRQNGGIARKISAQMMLDSLEAVSALEDSALLAELGFRRDNVFSLIMPDTYEVLWTDDMRTILTRQKQAYDAFWTDENRRKAALQGLTVEQVSILASIVKGETNYEPEMPKIAGVYLNRLRKGIKLQADPTIAFCYDYQLNRIFKKHLKVNSPYNTYANKGLPPGPIAVPTKACLEAVLNPDTAKNYLYFCANSSFDGTHKFASTYTEHLRNARDFQRALTIKQRAAK